ncbi:MAG: hypothetical protein NXI21_19365, partial [Alphaproteobacteria bacterium]|nr:hypothetical protein [Alphaproteobacteria bacterium]
MYRKPDGTAEVIRGGPESYGRIPFGADLAVEAGVPLAESGDAYKGDESPETRRARRIDLKGRDPEIVWGQMKAAVKQVGAAGIDYNVAPMQNSNSLIRHAFEAAALDPGDAFPAEFSPRAHPGFDNDLRDALHGPGAPDPDAAPGRAKGPDDGLRGWSDPEEPPRYPARDRKERRDAARRGEGDRSEAPAAREAPAAMDAGLRERAARELAAIPELESIQLKPPADWTEGEMRRLLRDPLYWDGPEPDRTALRDGVAGWFAAQYGAAPARRDGTGRMVEPLFTTQPTREAAAPRAADGAPLDRALAGVADALGRA